MKKKIMTGLMAMVLLFAGCGSKEEGEMVAPELPEITGESEAEEDTEITSGGETEANKPYEVEMESFRKDELCNISYPQISGWENEEKQQEWNVIFENCAQEAVQDIGENDSVDMSFTIEEQTEDFLSLTVTSYYDFEGAAHPSATMKSFNINMKTGEKVTFADMADPKETAELLFNGTEGYQLLGVDELTMQDVLSYNFIWMEPTVEALEGSLSHFDGEMEEYGENETMGYSFRRDGKVCLIFYVNHAMGDYVVVQLEG